MLKLGLVARIIMIVAVALFIIQLAAFAAAQLKPDTPFNPERSPAKQVKTAIRLLDAIPPEAQQAAVRALNANGLAIHLADPPAPGREEASNLTLTDKLAREFAAIALGNRYFNMRSLSEKPQGWFSVGAPDRIVPESEPVPARLCKDQFTFLPPRS